MMEHKGYIGYVTFDDEAELFHGEVINTRDVITFHGQSVDEIMREFVDSVEDYLEFCESCGEEAEKPFSGKLSIRLKPALHKQVYIAAKIKEKSLNSWISDTLCHALELHD